jgi:hypothetical protein
MMKTRQTSTLGERRARARKNAVVAAARPRKKRPDDLHPATSDRYYSDDEWEFMQAVVAYQAKHNVKFLLVTEYMTILQSLGYRKP